MSYKVKVSAVTFGGDGRDNPPDLSRDSYNLFDYEQNLQYINMDVIHTLGNVTYQVTALVEMDPKTGQPMLSPNNDLRMPCPPYC